ncbi:MAG TPA: hypothetical protein VNZ25_01430 [Candidatus Angelobacter sp.]|nr:hypothetical protein [Candidatus Angelobacter sp.]
MKAKPGCHFHEKSNHFNVRRRGIADGHGDLEKELIRGKPRWGWMICLMPGRNWGNSGRRNEGEADWRRRGDFSPVAGLISGQKTSLPFFTARTRAATTTNKGRAQRRPPNPQISAGKNPEPDNGSFPGETINHYRKA